jgi:hypothetical protein
VGPRNLPDQHMGCSGARPGTLDQAGARPGWSSAALDQERGGGGAWGGLEGVRGALEGVRAPPRAGPVKGALDWIPGARAPWTRLEPERPQAGARTPWARLEPDQAGAPPGRRPWAPKKSTLYPGPSPKKPVVRVRERSAPKAGSAHALRRTLLMSPRQKRRRSHLALGDEQSRGLPPV